MSEVPLSAAERKTLLEIARSALIEAVNGREIHELPLDGLTPRLSSLGASFVTLTRKGDLRGCIGGLQARYPLAEDVRQHTVAAALQDYRFGPVEPAEVGEVEIEISVLNTPQLLTAAPPEALLKALRPGIDGVILISGPFRATFLPQVWEKIPEPDRFLDTLCAKAGIPAHTWRSGEAEVFAYQVESFHETREAG
jgi:AmmeMemoRadiSam system protein A